MNDRINELKQDIKNYKELLKTGSLNISEQTWAELQLIEWRKELKLLNKELKQKP